MDKALIISEIMKAKKFESDTEFADFLGISKQSIYDWKRRNSMNYELMLEKIPELNANWLITGKGSMFKNEDTIKKEQEESEMEDILSIIGSDNPNIAEYNQYLEMEIEVEKLRAENKVLRKYLPIDIPITIASEGIEDYNKEVSKKVSKKNEKDKKQ